MIKFADNIRSWLYCLLPLLFSMNSHAQVIQHPAEERYEMARDLYEEGRLKLVIDTLLPFFDQRSPRRSDILSLSAVSYKFLDDDSSARRLLLQLFNLDPFYPLDRSIPELRYLENELVIYPKITFRGRAGLFLINRPLILNKGSISEGRIVSEKYALEAGDQVGSLMEVSVGQSLWPEGPYLQAGLGLSRYSFRYTGVYNEVPNPNGVLDRATFSFREKHWWFHLPVYLKQHLLMGGKDFREQIFIPYGYAGLSFDFMRRPSAEWTDISLQYQAMDEPAPLIFNDIAIKDLRNAFNISLLAGVGIQARSGYHLGFIELGFSQMLRNLRKEDSAAQFLLDRIEREFHYRGADFLLSNLQLSLGYSRFFYGAEAR